MPPPPGHPPGQQAGVIAGLTGLTTTLCLWAWTALRGTNTNLPPAPTTPPSVSPLAADSCGIFPPLTAAQCLAPSPATETPIPAAFEHTTTATMAGLAWSLLEFQGCFVLQLLSALLVILEPRLCSAAFLHSLSLMRGSTTYQVVTGLSRPIVSLIGQWLGYPNAYLLAYHFLELACTYLIVYLYAGPLDKPSEPTEAERLTAEIKNLRLKHSEELDVWAAKVCQRDEKITEVKAQVEEAKEETRLANEELYHLRDQRVQFGVNYQAAGEKLKDRQKKIDSAKKELQQLNLEIAEKTKQAVSHSSTTDPSHSHDGEKMPDVRQLGESKKAVKTFEFQSKPDPNISATAIALPSDEEGVLGGKRRVIPAVRPSTTMETRKAPNVLKPSILRSQAPGRQDLSNSNLDFEFVPFGKSAHPK